MKFLIDNQLPPALAGFLNSRGHVARHVLEIGLEAATDTEISDYASANSLTLVTKDEDFVHLASRPDASLQVVWVRRGNCRTTELLAAFDSVLPQLEAAIQAGNRLIEIR